MQSGRSFDVEADAGWKNSIYRAGCACPIYNPKQDDPSGTILRLIYSSVFAVLRITGELWQG